MHPGPQDLVELLTLGLIFGVDHGLDSGFKIKAANAFPD